jgi:hypothetical protein
MSIHDEILKFIDELPQAALENEIEPVRTKESIEMIARITEESGKTVSEAVLVFMAVIRYLAKNGQQHPDVIRQHGEEIIRLSVEKGVQANLPSRALPIFEVLHNKVGASSYSVIELGSSAGLIGRCLMNPNNIVERKELYLTPQQQLPSTMPLVNGYMGIDLSLPDDDWLIACDWEPNHRRQLERFLADCAPMKDQDFSLHEGNVFGFSTFPKVNDFVARSVARGSTVVVLTSFMLYQYEEEQKKQLRGEIFGFLTFNGGYGAHWINQDVNLSASPLEYYIELDGEKIVELSDDACIQWTWKK